MLRNNVKPPPRHLFTDNRSRKWGFRTYLETDEATKRFHSVDLLKKSYLWLECWWWFASHSQDCCRLESCCIAGSPNKGLKSKYSISNDIERICRRIWRNALARRDTGSSVWWGWRWWMYTLSVRRLQGITSGSVLSCRFWQYEWCQPVII